MYRKTGDPGGTLPLPSVALRPSSLTRLDAWHDAGTYDALGGDLILLYPTSHRLWCSSPFWVRICITMVSAFQMRPAPDATIWKFHVLMYRVCRYYGLKYKSLPKPQLLTAAEPRNECQRVAQNTINTHGPSRFIQPILCLHKWNQQYLISDNLVAYSRTTREVGSRHLPIHVWIPVWRRYLPPK